MPIAYTDTGARRYEVIGSGNTLVMLLPKSTGPFGVKNFIHGLSKSFSVLTYDQNKEDHDNLISKSEDVSIEGFAEETATLLTAIGKQEIILCCHSTGCGIGLALTARYPKLIKGLLLINPWLWPDDYLIAIQNMRIKMAESLDPVNYSKFNSSLLFPPFYRRMYHAEFERLAESATLKPHDSVQIKKRLNAIINYDARPITHKIQCPTLILSAHDDQLMPRWFSEGLAARIKQTHLSILRDGGHMLPETRGDSLTRKIHNFSQRI